MDSEQSEKVDELQNWHTWALLWEIRFGMNSNKYGRGRGGNLIFEIIQSFITLVMMQKNPKNWNQEFDVLQHSSKDSQC